MNARPIAWLAAIAIGVFFLMPAVQKIVRHLRLHYPMPRTNSYLAHAATRSTRWDSFLDTIVAEVTSLLHSPFMIGCWFVASVLLWGLLVARRGPGAGELSRSTTRYLRTDKIGQSRREMSSFRACCPEVMTNTIEPIGQAAPIPVDVGPKRQQGSGHMKRLILAASMAAGFCVVAGTPLFAADSTIGAVANDPAPSASGISDTTPAKACLSDLQAFDSQMEKEGYWLSGSGYGFGYPIDAGYGYGAATGLGASPIATAADYQAARPGYEVRMLLASANILARHGQQQGCEEVLATTREIYKVYVADVRAAGTPKADIPGWREHEIATARPVTEEGASYRADALLGTDVRNPQNEALGSIDDIVMSPETGKIAFLVVSRGGIFGLGEKYVAVPWGDFQATPDMSLLVLDSTKVDMDAAPQAKDGKFAADGHFDQESQLVDSYWKTHIPD
jgi:sporulation protein YlmC with PRC-barrel domain